MVGFLHGGIVRELESFLSRDRKKKKFVTVGQVDAKAKRVKTESGQWIQSSYKTDTYVDTVAYCVPSLNACILATRNG